MKERKIGISGTRIYHVTTLRVCTSHSKHPLEGKEGDLNKVRFLFFPNKLNSSLNFQNKIHLCKKTVIKYHLKLSFVSRRTVFTVNCPRGECVVSTMVKDLKVQIFNFHKSLNKLGKIVQSLINPLLFVLQTSQGRTEFATFSKFTYGKETKD